MKAACRHLVLILGDQLDESSSAFDGFDRDRDVVCMAEVTGESTHVKSHKARIVLFLSAMRHFRDALRRRRWTVDYHSLGDAPEAGTMEAAVSQAIRRRRPEKLVLVEPGDWRVRQAIVSAATTCGVPLEERPDQHFLCPLESFAAHARGRKQLRLEFFYREMRRRHNVLMEGNQPVGGSWNFDAENRGSFGRSGPEDIPEPRGFAPDKLTREVMKLVEDRFAEHPGSLSAFDWPVTRSDALKALDDFIRHRLHNFGRYQDAMWQDAGSSRRRDVYLYHSRLSTALNLKLLNPREVIGAAESAHSTGAAPLPSVEGFVRQILGWREYVRGIYWQFMPKYLAMNTLGASEPLPHFYWTGDTEMNCLNQVIRQTLDFGYAHHIQRLMVTGLYALLLGVQPKAVHEWYLAVYVDAVEWVELPNTLGMSQHADGGKMASKPYVATGKYIQRMSNYCAGCRFDPAEATGEDACPFTTLYWDFLMRHKTFLSKNQRMTMQLRNLDRLTDARKRQIRQMAGRIRKTGTE